VRRLRYLDVREYVPGGTRRVREVGPVFVERETMQAAERRLSQDYPGHLFVRWTWDESARKWRRA